jgi:hypothetical protein
MRSLHTIAREIAHDWVNPYFGAIPYLSAMLSLDSIGDKFGHDNARSIVLYFLSNSGRWQGPVARAVKLELRSMLK